MTFAESGWVPRRAPTLGAVIVPVGLGILLAGLGAAGRAAAAEAQAAARPWSVASWAELDESVTDNARLAPSPRTADLITAPTLGVTAQGATRRLTGWFDASGTYDKYAVATDMDGFVYGLHGYGTAELADNLAYLDLRSAVDTQALNPGGPAPADGRTLPVNQVRVFNTSVSPYLRHEFGTWGTAELRYRLSAAEFAGANVGTAAVATPAADGAIPGNTLTNEGQLTLQSGEALSRLRLGLTGDLADTAYAGVARTVNSRTLTASAEYALVRQVAVTAKLGYDSFDDTALGGGAAAYPSWRGGLRLTPGPRTTLDVEAGERYGGPYWSAALTYRISPRLTLTGSHDTTVTTQQQQLAASLNGMVAGPSGQLVNPLTGLGGSPNQQPFSYVSQSYVIQTSQITLAGQRGRTSLVVDAFYQRRDLGAVSLSQSPFETQTVIGLTPSVIRTLTPRSDVRLDLSISRLNDSVPNQGSTTGQAGLSYDYKLLPSLMGFLSYRYYLLSDQAGTSFRENLGFIGLRKEF